jgi:ribokinase
VALILVNEEGNNSIIVVPGSNGRLCSADVYAGRSLIEKAGIILTQLETPIEALEATVDVTSATGVPVMLDPAPAQLLSPELLRRIDWFTPNETEAAFFSGRQVPDDTDIRIFAEHLLALGPRNILLKLGARGAYLATRSGLREYVPAPPVRPLDSTAAGDALNGAFATALMQGANPLEAVRFGVAAASLSVTRAGAIASLPTLAELEEFRMQHV